MPYLLRYRDIEFGSHFEKWPSPRYAQFFKFPPSRILKPYVYITQTNSQTSILPKCLRAYRAGPGLYVVVGTISVILHVFLAAIVILRVSAAVIVIIHMSATIIVILRCIASDIVILRCVRCRDSTLCSLS